MRLGYRIIPAGCVGRPMEEIKVLCDEKMKKLTEKTEDMIKAL